MASSPSYPTRQSQPATPCSVSVEVLSKNADKIPSIARNFPKGTRVYITFLGMEDMDKQVETAKAIRLCGLEPVPHIAARYFESNEQLESHLQKLVSEAKVTEVLAIGGNPKKAGIFDSTLALLETGLLEKHAIQRVGLAGHPEGNKDITDTHGEQALLEALSSKQKYLQEHGMEGYIATQFLFNAQPLIDWTKQLRENGIDLPIHVGIPGPNTPAKLARYALSCGVGTSFIFAKTHSNSIGNIIITPTPEKLVDDLMNARQSHPELGIEGLHFYPFGNFDGLVDWMKKEKPELLGGGVSRQ